MKDIKKAVILAGGKGTRLSEYTHEIPKPMIRVGPYPLMIHIMRNLHKSGIDEFYICGGYLINIIRDYLINNADVVLDDSEDSTSVKLHKEILGDSIVNLIFTGAESGTAQRLKRISKFIGNDNFIMTYGDSLSNVDVNNVKKKLGEDKILAICAIPNKQRFGLMKVEKNGDVTEFKEKHTSNTHFINGGYMCIKPEIFQYIDDEDFDFSKDVLEKPELKGKIAAYIHNGYWKAVDTKSDLDESIDEYNKGDF